MSLIGGHDVKLQHPQEKGYGLLRTLGFVLPDLQKDS